MDKEIIIELIGYAGALINTVSTVPQIIKTYLTKDVTSLSILFLLSWFLGCLLLFIYILLTSGTIPLYINYICNVLFPLILIIMYYKYKQ